MKNIILYILNYDKILFFYRFMNIKKCEYRKFLIILFNKFII